jgi:gag-polypeptide of LTR copia-type/Zinc knuckle
MGSYCKRVLIKRCIRTSGPAHEQYIALHWRDKFYIDHVLPFSLATAGGILHSHFMESRCPDKTKMREFLDGLCVKKEELSTFGVDIEERDYHSMIIKCLPPHLSAFASNLLAGAKLYSSTKTIEPDELITLVSEEYEHHVSQQSRRSRQASGKGGDKDEALTMSGNGKGKTFDQKPKGTCWNCGDKGHLKNKCPKPAKVVNKKHDSQKTSGSANAAVESDDEEEAAFFADFDEDELPPLLLNYESDTDDEDYGDCEGDWFSDAENQVNELSGTDESNTHSFVSDSSNLLAADLEDTHAVSVNVNSPVANSPHVEVYDSRCTRHITPYRDAVQTLIKISPTSFQASNKQSFNAVGMGEMIIDVPMALISRSSSSPKSYTHLRSATPSCQLDNLKMQGSL